MNIDNGIITSKKQLLQLFANTSIHFMSIIICFMTKNNLISLPKEMCFLIFFTNFVFKWCLDGQLMNICVNFLN